MGRLGERGWGHYVDLRSGGSERVLRESLDVLVEMGETGYLSSVAGILAQALYRQGRYDEAADMADLCRSNAGRWDVDAQCAWRTAHAGVAAQRGKLEDAKALAREAIALIDATDYLNERADTYMALAEVLQLGGQAEEATAAVQHAVELYGHKGATYLVEKAQAQLATLRSRS